MKPFQFSGPASAEFTEAVRWYEGRRPGLGGDFYDAVVQTVDVIRAHPEIGIARRGRLPNRQFRLTRFPYKIVYRVRETDIYVVAVTHEPPTRLLARASLIESGSRSAFSRGGS